MNGVFDIFSEFLRDLRAQKLRTALTVFGIVWGTVAIVVLLAFGMGFKKQLSINMHGIGESIAIMFPGSTTRAFEGFGVGRPMKLVEEDVPLLEVRVPGIDRISPEYLENNIPIRVGDSVITTLVGGVIPVYGDIRNVIPEPDGRFLNDTDVKDRKRVVVLGNEVRRLLFGTGPAVGKIVDLGGIPFLVVGVMQKKTQNSSYQRRDQDRVFIPTTTFCSVYGADRLSNIIFTSRDPSRSKETIAQVRQVLGRKYRFDPEDTDAIWIWDTAEFDKFLSSFFLAFNIFMGLIGSFTLAVGGIGVANIMNIVVQERMLEIGVRRAVGARRRTILFQFFAETMLIILAGAVIGFVIALGITAGLQYIPIREFVGTPVVSVEVALATTAVLALIGLAAGLMPARRASRLAIVDCLRS